MIIHQPEKIGGKTHTILYARIELASRVEGFPKYVWYRTPNRFAGHFVMRGDAFLVPALIAAMRFGEPIQVRGEVSPRLAYHLDEYQFLMKMYFPKILQPVKVAYERLVRQDIAELRE